MSFSGPFRVLFLSLMAGGGIYEFEAVKTGG
jgi:hypothetical protein